MASRLSTDTLPVILDSGIKGFSLSLDRASTEHNPVFIKKIDLDALMAEENPRASVQSLDAHRLYVELLARGVEDCIEVLPYLSQEQFIKICDFDVWSGDSLVPAKAFYWLKMFREVSDQEMLKRFRELEEEVQLAILGSSIELIEIDDYEKLSSEHQDQFTPLPCQTLFYRVTSDNLVDDIEDLITVATQENMLYAYSLLAHAAFLPPNEQEFAAAQFRQARMEEDGFVNHAEALQVFQNIDLGVLRRKYWRAGGILQDSSQPLHLKQYRPRSGSYLQEVIKSLAEVDHHRAGVLLQSLVHLGNTFCAALQVEPSDIQEMKIVLARVQALTDLGLEYLSLGDLTVAESILKAEHPRILVQAAATLLADMQKKFLKSLVQLHTPACKKLYDYWSTRRYGLLLTYLDTHFIDFFGFEDLEMIKGLFNRFPLILNRDASSGQKGLFTPLATLQQLQLAIDFLDVMAAKLQALLLALSHTDSEAKDIDHSEVLNKNLDDMLLDAMTYAMEEGNFVIRTPADRTTHRQILANDKVDNFLRALETTLNSFEMRRDKSWIPSKEILLGDSLAVPKFLDWTKKELMARGQVVVQSDDDGLSSHQARETSSGAEISRES